MEDQEVLRRFLLQLNSSTSQELSQPDNSYPPTSQSQEEFEEMLVEEVQKYNCLWNTKSSSFKDNQKKCQAWQNISNKLGEDGEKLI